MLRFILVCFVVFFFFGPLGIPYMLICLLAGLFSERRRAVMATRYLTFGMKCLLFVAGAKVEAIGLENIPDGPVYYVSNHRGYADIFCTYQFVTGICGTVSKIEFSRVPFLSAWMRLIHCVFLDRTSPRKGIESMKAVTAELLAGNSAWIYPEGTRNHTADMLPFKEGSFRPAFQTGTPVLPVVITHTDDLYELHKPFIRPTHIKLIFCKPYETAGIQRSEHKSFVQTLEKQMQQTYNDYV